MVDFLARASFELGDLLPVERAFDWDYAKATVNNSFDYAARVGPWDAHFTGNFKHGAHPHVPFGFPYGIVEHLWVRQAGGSGYDINDVFVHSTILNRLDGAEEVGKYVFRHGDRIVGSNQNDRLYGFGGHDVIEGRGGIDVLYGGNGNDRLDAGSGHSNLFGGEGEDVFIFTRAVTTGVVEDFEKGDRIDFSAFQTSFDELTLNEQRGFVVIQLTDDHRVDIGGDNANLRAEDFIF